MKLFKSFFIVAAVAGSLCASALNIAAIEHASVRNDLERLVALRAAADAQSEPYAAALLEYRIGIAANVAGDDKVARRSLKASAGILEELVKREPDSVAALSLLSNVYGMTIGVSPMKGPFLGRKAQRLVDRALEVAPNDPHALLTKGISKHNTPSMFGGSHSAALAWLDKAIDAFAASPRQASWGEAEAYVWRALTLDALERREEAIASLNEALQREPDYAWARYILANLTGSAG